MKVLFVANDPSVLVEGSTTRLRMREYAEVIGTLHIVTQAKSTQEVHDGMLHVYGVQCNRFTRMKALSKKIRELVAFENIQIVSAQDPFEHGRAAVQGIKGTSAKLHLQVHTDFLSPWFIRSGNFRSPMVAMPALNRIRRGLADEVLPQAAGIRVVSARIRMSLIERYGKQIVDPVVIPIRVSVDVPEPVKLPPHPFTFALLTVGRLEPEKRMEDIIAALVLLRDQYPAVGLFIVGEGSERKRLERMVREHKLTDRVQFLGARSDAVGLMRSAQAYIQASAYEGYGRTLIEAALVGIPIITTDVGIVGEVFRGYEDVLAAPVADPTMLAGHIRGFVEDMHARTALVMHAEISVREHLKNTDSSAQAVARDLERLISS